MTTLITIAVLYFIAGTIISNVDSVYRKTPNDSMQTIVKNTLGIILFWPLVLLYEGFKSMTTNNQEPTTKEKANEETTDSDAGNDEPVPSRNEEKKESKEESTKENGTENGQINQMSLFNEEEWEKIDAYKVHDTKRNNRKYIHKTVYISNKGRVMTTEGSGQNPVVYTPQNLNRINPKKSNPIANIKSNKFVDDSKSKNYSLVKYVGWSFLRPIEGNEYYSRKNMNINDFSVKNVAIYDRNTSEMVDDYYTLKNKGKGFTKNGVKAKPEVAN